MDEAISPEYLAEDGKFAYRRGDYLEAANSFEAARQSYLTKDDRLAAAEMANNASVAYLKAGDFKAALSAVEGTAEIYSEVNDQKRTGIALGNRAAALEALSRDDEAIALYRQSAKILALSGEDQLSALVMQSISMLQFRKGLQLQALATMQNGLDGVKHPSPKQFMLKKILRIPFNLVMGNKRT